jgi:orotidine-5'-phosphate decarboxylase
MPSVSAAERLILALDLPTGREALALARRLTPPLRRVKVGPGLFALEGADLIRPLRELGLGVFLDLKLHDIPNTVREAALALGGLGIEFLTVHLSGGEAMARAAVEGARGNSRILGVTLLSSLDAAAARAIGFAGAPGEIARRLAGIGVAAGVDGVVCSPLEAKELRPIVAPPRLLVTPGIRPRGKPADDQARTATAAEAFAAGADLLVVGRPVLRAVDPLEALDALIHEAGAARAEAGG